MRVAVTGASGFVGQHLVRHLASQGHEVRGLSRGGDGLARVRAAGGEAVRGDVTEPASLKPLVEGCDAVVHLVAIIRERGAQTFDAVIRGGAANALDAARNAGVRRFVHQSALGAADEPRYPYLRAKWQAEEAVRASGLAWTVLRPSILFGEGDHVFTLLADMAAKQPVMPVIGSGDMRLQPLGVGDLARIVERCLRDPATAGRTYDLGGPERVRYEDMVKAAMEASGHRRATVRMPVPLMRLAAQGMALVLREPPITPGELDILLRGDNVTDADSVRRHFGFEPRPFREGLGYLRGAGAPGARGAA